MLNHLFFLKKYSSNYCDHLIFALQCASLLFDNKVFQTIYRFYF